MDAGGRQDGRGQRVRVLTHAWLEVDGGLWLGEGRVALLVAIAEHRSISGAARACGMSYRRAWTLVSRMNEMAAQPLVVTATGGTGGGGAQLTPAGEEAVRLFRALEERLARFRDETAEALSRVSDSAPLSVPRAIRDAAEG